MDVSHLHQLNMVELLLFNKSQSVFIKKERGIHGSMQYTLYRKTIRNPIDVILHILNLKTMVGWEILNTSQSYIIISLKIIIIFFFVYKLQKYLCKCHWSIFASQIGVECAKNRKFVDSQFLMHAMTYIWMSCVGSICVSKISRPIYYQFAWFILQLNYSIEDHDPYHPRMVRCIWKEKKDKILRMTQVQWRAKTFFLNFLLLC